MSSSNNKPTSAADLAEFEALAGLTTTSLKSTGTSRWERKRTALNKTSLSSQNTPSKKSRTSTESASSPSKHQADRFIPSRSSSSGEIESSLLANSSDNNTSRGAAEQNDQSEYQKMLEAELCGDHRDHRVLTFKNRAPMADQVFLSYNNNTL